MAYEYNGNGMDYLEKARSRHQKRLTEMYYNALKRSQEADQQVEQMRQKAMGLFNGHIRSQQQLDDQLIDQLEQNQQAIGSDESETQDAFDRYQQAINSLQPNESFEYQPHEEDDRAKLERLYSEF